MNNLKLVAFKKNKEGGLSSLDIKTLNKFSNYHRSVKQERGPFKRHIYVWHVPLF